MGTLHGMLLWVDPCSELRHRCSAHYLAVQQHSNCSTLPHATVMQWQMQHLHCMRSMTTAERNP
jgi:hypothetical protein